MAQKTEGDLPNGARVKPQVAVRSRHRKEDCMQTFRRDKLRRLVEAGRVTAVGSYHFDDR